jgi:lysophospholipase L1-like esterase
MIKNFKWLFLVSLTIAACSSDDDSSTEPADLIITPGSADFSKYVALGNSLTAGFSDGALFVASQQNAYPKLMAEQFALPNGGGGAFKVPYMNDNVGGLLLGGTPIQGPRLIFNGVAPVPLPGGIPTTEVTSTLAGPFNNMGIPGAKSFHLVAPGYGNIAGVATGQANPYFARFASSPSTSVIQDAVAQNPTFFSLWIGNNDILSYATSGGTGVNQSGNLNPATYGGNDITDPTVFASVYTSLINALTTNGAKGVVANLPYVTSIPYFTTVPTNPIPGLPPASATQLNQLFGGINAALAANGLPARFSTLVADDGNPSTREANPLLIVDDSLVNISAQITAALSPLLGVPTATFLGGLYGQARHASSAAATRDFIVLPARGVIGTTQPGVPPPFNTVGVSFPMQDSTTLTAFEANQVIVATDAFNVSIKAIADAKGLAFVDANALMKQLASGGIRFENFTMTATYVQGGAFSLDGVHITARGNAYIANKFLEAINTTYGSNFPAKRMAEFPISYPPFLN